MPVRFEELAASLSDPGSKPRAGTTAVNGGPTTISSTGAGDAYTYTKAEATKVDGRIDLMNSTQAPGVGTAGASFNNIDDPSWTEDKWSNDDIILTLPPVSAVDYMHSSDPCQNSCMKAKLERESKCDIVRKRVQYALNQAGCFSTILKGPELGSCGQVVNSGCSTCSMAMAQVPVMASAMPAAPPPTACSGGMVSECAAPGIFFETSIPTEPSSSVGSDRCNVPAVFYGPPAAPAGYSAPVPTALVPAAPVTTQPPVIFRFSGELPKCGPRERNFFDNDGNMLLEPADNTSRWQAQIQNPAKRICRIAQRPPVFTVPLRHIIPQGDICGVPMDGSDNY